MKPAPVIIERLGGVRAAARLLEKPVSTVHSWKVSGFIPPKHQRQILDVAKARKIRIKPADFIGPAGSDEVPA